LFSYIKYNLGEKKEKKEVSNKTHCMLFDITPPNPPGCSIWGLCGICGNWPPHPPKTAYNALYGGFGSFWRYGA